MLKIFDTHCHLDSPVFSNDCSEVLERSYKVGVRGLIVPGVTGASRLELNFNHGIKIFKAWGKHPIFEDNYLYNENAFFDKDAVCDAPFVAIGECGLDRRYKFSLESQLALFKKQLEIATELKIPVIVHLVGYWDEAIKLAKQYCSKSSPWILHSFSGSAELAERFLSMGCFLSFSGNICREKNHKTLKVAESVPLDRILIETDSPDMAVEIFPSKRNEPANLRIIFEKVANIKGISAEKMSEILLHNTYNAFNLSIEI